LAVQLLPSGRNWKCTAWNEITSGAHVRSRLDGVYEQLGSAAQVGGVV